MCLGCRLALKSEHGSLIQKQNSELLIRLHRGSTGMTHHCTLVQNKISHIFIHFILADYSAVLWCISSLVWYLQISNSKRNSYIHRLLLSVFMLFKELKRGILRFITRCDGTQNITVISECGAVW